MENSRVHLIIKGYVQGVFYRASTREKAVELGLKGWVRNMNDGNVEAVFEGPVDKIQQAVEWCQEGPAGAKVLDIEKKWQKYLGEFNGFHVRYS
jgi:acylphosphatase